MRRVRTVADPWAELRAAFRDLGREMLAIVEPVLTWFLRHPWAMCALGVATLALMIVGVLGR